MKDKAKMAGRDIAKKRLEANYKRDEMVAISSSDFADKNSTPAESLDKSPNKYDDILNSVPANPSKTFGTDKPKVNSFQKMLADNELKGVTKKQPKKGMQLGKKKPKKNDLQKELEKQKVLDEQESKAEGDAQPEEAKTDEIVEAN